MNKNNPSNNEGTYIDFRSLNSRLRILILII